MRLHASHKRPHYVFVARMFGSVWYQVGTIDGFSNRRHAADVLRSIREFKATRSGNVQIVAYTNTPPYRAIKILGDYDA